MKVFCFGSLNIDYTYKVDHFVQKGETISSESLQVFSGGKGLNQSIALAKAGADTWHAGSIGEDGRFLLAQMEEAGVHTQCITVLEETRTGNAIIQNDTEGDNCIILYGGANQAITREQVDEVMRQCQKGDFLVLQNEINELAYIMEQAHKNGLRIVLNPSPMNEKIRRLPLEYVDYFLLNEVEAGQILGREVKEGFDKEELGKALRECFLQPSYRVRAVDTTAAGDTFTGYFIGGLLRGLAVREAMDLAARASAIAVTRLGASPSIPCLKEVEAYSF